MRQKLSSLVFNGPRAKTKTVFELACKMEPKSSIIQSVSDMLGHFVSIYCTLHTAHLTALCTLYSAYCSLYTLHCTSHCTFHCTLQNAVLLGLLGVWWLTSWKVNFCSIFVGLTVHEVDFCRVTRTNTFLPPSPKIFPFVRALKHSTEDLYQTGRSGTTRNLLKIHK